MTKMLYHVYVPKYDLQGPTVETEKPLDEKMQQKMISDFFGWLKGDQNELRKQIVTKEATIDIVPTQGYVSRRSAILMTKIRKRYGERPKEGLTADQYEKLLEGKLFAAKWFKE